MSLAAGLYGKLPAHGDFIARGWRPAETAGLDAWLTQGLAHARTGLDEAAFARTMTAMPLWRVWLPPGWVGDKALHGALAASIDKAGRYFFIVAGALGEAADLWALAVQHPAFSARVEDILFAALGGAHDADECQAEIAAALPAITPAERFRAGLALPAEALFWTPEPAQGPPVKFAHRAADAHSLSQLIAGVGA